MILEILVALLAEGVDRNIDWDGDRIYRISVALLAEGVDRNLAGDVALTVQVVVALLAEGVDRNLMIALTISSSMSRPPRGGRG